tara:strand:+ start:472 stop:651 length:180 start_codon:yes stop_codon:yes gene_type:complete
MFNYFNQVVLCLRITENQKEAIQRSPLVMLMLMDEIQLKALNPGNNRLSITSPIKVCEP